jgi:putative transcriptional regulator
MKRRRIWVDGDVFHQPLKRPHGRENPMRDPLRVSRTLSGRRGRGRRARDRREFEPVDVRGIRRLFAQTRGQFADMIGISKETLRNWERGRRYPVGPSRALLRIAAADPDVVAAVLVLNRASWVRADPDEET